MQEHLLLIRFSALGDILMTVPIVEQLARQYPQMQITMVSRPFVRSIFERLPENVHFVGINPRQYPGLSGLSRMYSELKELHPTMVCDLHDVLRTKYLRWRFRFSGLPTSHIVKDRKARKAFIKAEVKTQQETSFERYAKALRKLLVDFQPTSRPQGQPPRPPKGGDNMEGASESGIQKNAEIDSPKKSTKGFAPQSDRVSNSTPTSVVSPLGGTGGLSIGIAPFAAHPGKIYPLDQMERVVELLSQQGHHVYLFGAGDQEKSLMEEWEKRYEHVESMVGKLENMAAELQLMSTLDVMLTMDSGNMHLAALCGVRTVSIWGATHPLGGFLGWGQTLDDVIQQDLPCRPCSTFGNKPCKFGDYRCLATIRPEDIVKKLLESHTESQSPQREDE